MPSRPAAPLPETDERPAGLTNDALVFAFAQVSVWIGVAVLLSRTAPDPASEAIGYARPVVLLGLCMGTAYGVCAIADRRRLGVWRWPVLGAALLIWGLVTHFGLTQLGLREGLVQDLVNVVLLAGIALAVQAAWVGLKARRMLALRETALRLTEARLAQAQVVAGAGRSSLVQVKVGHEQVAIDPRRVSHIEAAGNFSTLHREQGPLFTSEPLKALLARMEPHGFRRVHKSFAVNADYIASRRSDALSLRNGVVVPVGRAFRRQAEWSISDLGAP